VEEHKWYALQLSLIKENRGYFFKKRKKKKTEAIDVSCECK
jgi:hypothetical protein